MQKQPNLALNSNGALTALSISPIEEDHFALADIITHPLGSLLTADTVSTAKTILLRRDVSVILCERDLKPGTWIEMLEYTTSLQRPPALIVTSRLADDRLWSEVLNLGGWDVLAKPFDRCEVSRSVESAWRHRQGETNVPVQEVRAFKAAS